MSSGKIVKFEDKVILCDMSDGFLAINQVTPKKEVTEIHCNPADSLPSASMFFINDNEYIQYYVWYNKDNIQKDPNPGGKIGLEVVINTGDTAETIAQKTASVISNSPSFDAVQNGSKVLVECKTPGTVYPPKDFNTGYYIEVKTKGRYTTSLYSGRPFRDCGHIKDFNLFQDGSAELFYTRVKTYTDRTNYVQRFDVHKEFYDDVYVTLPEGWLKFLS